MTGTNRANHGLKTIKMNESFELLDALPWDIRKYFVYNKTGIAPNTLILTWIKRGMSSEEITNKFLPIMKKIEREATIKAYGPDHPNAEEI